MAYKKYKLSIISALFFVALGLSLTSGVSNTISTPTKTAVNYVDDDDTDYNDHTHNGWISLSQADFETGDYTSGNLTGGTIESETTYYYLYEDIELTSMTITISNYATLCLNGHTLKATDVTTYVLTISDYSNFKLYDCSADNEGVITGSAGGVLAYSGVIFDMYGGSIKGCGARSNGGTVHMLIATFNMYGGTISGNTSSDYGGGVAVSSRSTFNMYGGTISGNYSTNGGGVCVQYYSNFNMYGGTISGNTAPNGGGVNLQYEGTLNMYGGTISDNTATTYGGGIYLYSQYSFYGYSTLNMYGGIISNNYLNSQDNGVYVNRQSTFNLYSGYLNNQITTNSSGTYSVYGGYFTFDPSSYITLNNLQVVDISTIGSDLDDNYMEDYDYAIYVASSRSYQIYNVEATYGTTYTPEIDAEYTSVTFTYSYGGSTIIGLPTEVGSYYSVTAYFLNTVTTDNIITNYYATRGIYVTITRGQAEITLNSITKEYDGDVASIDYVATVGDLDITDVSVVTWFDENGEEINAPSEVGTYKATITVDDTDSYDGRSVNVNYTITKENSSSDATEDPEIDDTEDLDINNTEEPDVDDTEDLDIDDTEDPNSGNTGDLNTGDAGNSDNSGTEEPDNEGTTLSVGAIAGIVIGSILGVGLIAFGVYYFFFKNSTQKVVNK